LIIATFKLGYSNQIFLLNEKSSEYLQITEIQAASLKQQEEKIAQLATDREHWKRKSTSLSKELGRFNGSQIQKESAFAELKEANSVLKSKLKVIYYMYLIILSVLSVIEFDTYLSNFLSMTTVERGSNR
jgi:hypothetical protein